MRGRGGALLVLCAAWAAMAQNLADDQSSCGVHPPYQPASEADRIAGNKRCLEGRSFDKTPLEQLYEHLKVLQAPRVLRMFVKGWGTHKLLSAIAYILLNEVLGYEQNVVLCSTSSGGTSGSIQALAEIIAENGAELQSASVDIDIELWAGSALQEYQRHQAHYVQAGPTFSFGRSGLFLHTSAADTETMLRFGRTYSNLERDVLPLLPTLAEVRELDIWCNVPEGSHCYEAPTHACHEAAEDECRVVFKSMESYDKNLVEEIISNASLPLVIVYTGETWPSGFKKGESIAVQDLMPNRTILFYAWEPTQRAGPGTDWIRVNFEHPVVCEQNQSFAVVPERHACDFPTGNIHKGFSKRVELLYTDIAYMIKRFQVSTLDLIEMETTLDMDDESAVFDLACAWVLDHESDWTGWLLPGKAIRSTWQYWFPITFMSTIFSLMLAWAWAPFYLSRPEVGHQWVDLAASLKPTNLVRNVAYFICYPFVLGRSCVYACRPRLRRLKAWMQAVSLRTRQQLAVKIARARPARPTDSLDDLSSLPSRRVRRLGSVFKKCTNERDFTRESAV
jgi:hypothetical protein